MYLCVITKRVRHALIPLWKRHVYIQVPMLGVILDDVENMVVFDRFEDRVDVIDNSGTNWNSFGNGAYALAYRRNEKTLVV